MAPPWQWKRAGTDRHALAKETIEPASRTPKPKRWLNSKPTPFIVQSNRRLASKRELRFDVSTVKCWMSLHVKDGLVKKRTECTITLKGKFWFYLLGFQSESKYSGCFRCGGRSSRMRFCAFAVQVGGSLFCQVETFLHLFDYVRARHKFLWNRSHKSNKIPWQNDTHKGNHLLFKSATARLRDNMARSWCEKRVQLKTTSHVEKTKWNIAFSGNNGGWPGSYGNQD